MLARTVPDLLDARAVDAPARGVVFPDGRLSWPELASEARRLAAGLWANGVRPGDRVGILLHGGTDSVVAWFAAARIGAVTVPVNVRLKSAELRYVLEDADLAVLLTATAFTGLLEQALAGAPATPRAVFLVDDDAGRTALDAAAETIDPATVEAAQRTLHPDDAAVMLYTSGTTSRPRGCLHSHSALVNVGVSLAQRLGLTTADTFWTPLPMFHCGGIDVLMAALAARCGMVHVGSFEPGRALRQLGGEQCTVAFPAFETIWIPVLDHPDFAATDLSSLRLVINVGSPERMRSMQARVPHAVQISCLGMTESCGFCCVGSPEDPAEARAVTSGVPLPGMEARVVDPETGVEVPPGIPGEFRFRGVSRTLGYHRDPELTTQRIDADGWFASGDQVVADGAGRLRFLTRLGDVLKVGGENLAAAELEGFLCEHPAVGLVAVVGAPDARYGEVPAAFVQLRPGTSATEEEIVEFCRGRIATYKVPRYVRFVADAAGWPMSGTKIQKFRLRARISAELAERGVTQAPRVRSASATVSG